jgi:hypothetical protein
MRIWLKAGKRVDTNKPLKIDLPIQQIPVNPNNPNGPTRPYDPSFIAKPGWDAKYTEEELAEWGITFYEPDPEPNSNFYTYYEDPQNPGQWISTPKPLQELKDKLKESIKSEAYRRIIAIVPEWKQRNLIAQATQLLRIRSDRAWTVQEQAAWDAGDAVWDQVVDIRNHSDLIEAAIQNLNFAAIEAGWNNHETIQPLLTSWPHEAS